MKILYEIAISVVGRRDFEEQVMGALNAGWELHGDPIITRTASGDWTFAQAVVKYEQEESDRQLAFIHAQNQVYGRIFERIPEILQYARIENPHAVFNVLQNEYIKQIQPHLRS